MKVKILRNVIHNGVVLKKDAVHDIEEDKAAQNLIDGDHAAEHKPERSNARSQENGGPHRELMSKTVSELTVIITEWNKDKDNADRQITLVLATATKAQMVEAIMKAAGYSKPEGT